MTRSISFLEMKRIDLQFEIITDYNEYYENIYINSGYFGKRHGFELDFNKVLENIKALCTTDIGITNLKLKVMKYEKYLGIGTDVEN